MRERPEPNRVCESADCDNKNDHYIKICSRLVEKVKSDLEELKVATVENEGGRSPMRVMLLCVLRQKMLLMKPEERMSAEGLLEYGLLGVGYLLEDAPTQLEWRKNLGCRLHAEMLRLFQQMLGFEDTDLVEVCTYEVIDK